MSENFLSQEEIDALLRSQVQPQPAPGMDLSQEEQGLSREEIDVMGEVGNISMGSAATTLSDLVRNRVSITTPQIVVSTQKDLYGSFEKPYVVIDITYTEGLTGSNIFLISETDAVIIADLMMGGTGTNVGQELTELELSAVSEAMNQMMGSAATAMSNMFGFSVIISPPQVTSVEFDKPDYETNVIEGKIAVVSFRLVVGDLIDSQIMQIIPIKAAKEMVRYLLGPSVMPTQYEEEIEDAEDESNNFQAPSFPDGFQTGLEDEPKDEALEVTFETNLGSLESELDLTHSFSQSAGRQQNGEGSRNLDLILDVPLKVSVVLGRCKRPIGEVLKLVPGTIVELDSLANEPVDILVNGTLIAQGEVVVVNENFGIQVKNIISPQERLQRLRD